jgi:hypothetical protein
MNNTTSASLWHKYCEEQHDVFPYDLGRGSVVSNLLDCKSSTIILTVTYKAETIDDQDRISQKNITKLQKNFSK